MASEATTRAPDDTPPPHVQVIQMASAYWLSRAVYEVARLGLADLLADGPVAVEQLAQATSTQAPALRRVLRTIAAQGLFRTDEQGRFALTPLGATLRSDAPGSVRPTVLALTSDHWWESWRHLDGCLRTGETGMVQAHGQRLFEYLGQHPEDAANFNAAMIGFHGAEPPAVAAAYDFAGIGTLVDVGGGSGNLITTILRDNPGLRGVLFDLPQATSDGEKTIAATGLADRCRVVAGDFFEAVPEGGDAYLLSHIIHDWGEEECLRILSNCRRAMRDQARLLLVEWVLRPGDEPDPAKVLDLVMLVMPGGQERTEQEYRALLARAGFNLTRVVPTASSASVVEAIPS
jgi:O-methyltransferase domain/Dimerisation domain